MIKAALGIHLVEGKNIFLFFLNAHLCWKKWTIFTLKVEKKVSLSVHLCLTVVWIKEVSPWTHHHFFLAHWVLFPAALTHVIDEITLITPGG